VKVVGSKELAERSIKVTLKAKEHIYDGSEQSLTTATETGDGELIVKAAGDNKLLTEGSDYLLTYSNNLDAGTAKVFIIGMGEYIGSISKTFKIKSDKVSEVEAGLIDPEADIYYDSTKLCPQLLVTVNRGEKEVLVQGRDYKVSYYNNKNVGTGGYTVSFIGNYKGRRAIKGTFQIKQAPFSSASARCADIIYNKPGKYFSKPYVSMNGVLLKSKDYSVSYYDGDTLLSNKNKLILSDDESVKEITVKIKGKGNYQGDESNEIVTTYNVVRRSSELIDLTKAKIVAKEKNLKGKDIAVGRCAYTGSYIEPEIRVMYKEGKEWKDIPEEYYEVSYINNLNKGRATILVNGDSINTMGSRKAGFNIYNK
ncbi:MAG: hypothetical protein K5931_07760, partial [Lachnospiraceae bacterium]|nr:hypothetical protein [Lachnospiraceae bacterium]